MEKLYSIQEVSQILGISKDTLRYYDRIGIVSPSREENKYRRYSKDDLIDLMNIQIMQYVDFSLDEIRGTLNIRKMDNIDPVYCEEVSAFLDAKNAETRKKIAHLEKVSQLLNIAAETLRNFNIESDRRLAKIVREIYMDIRGGEPKYFKEGCDDHQG
ncbi:MerR family transcriptional regulator [Paenibacillus albiflavus]|uniref:MerR family transcriptional regulator n=1 Tax=Paenibacillus albiflavus TaxID=2545760 RepID=A0A4R4E7J0_9BACL|nr:MerR family transcriptional regulator [Paenibacillus albiflavus]TCZ75077.1 MerR family transcriptional regulator [Paenibacillus albiflavus]